MSHSIIITNHAKQRIKERLNDKMKDEDIFIYTRKVRYNSRTLDLSNKFEYAWYIANISKNQLVKIKDKLAFIFDGKKKNILITVIPFNLCENDIHKIFQEKHQRQKEKKRERENFK